MYLYSLSVEGFRRLGKLDLRFREGLNVLVGPNNAGKTAVIDALRVLLSTGDEGALRVNDLDLHVDASGIQRAQATFRYIFRDLSPDEEADFIQALKPVYEAGKIVGYEAHLAVRYSNPDSGGRLHVKRWAGEHEDTSLTSEMLNDLRAVYLQPLRDPAQGLRPGRASQLARLIQSLSSPAAQEEVVNALKTLDTTLKTTESIKDTQSAITKRHTQMLGTVLSQAIEVSLSPSDFKRVASRLGLLAANFEVEQNGLGFNNLIYMAVVLSELALSKESAYRALLVEEPEAHLHPQLQAVLLNYLKSVEDPAEGEKAVQVFLTSHSPNFAALADVDSIGCVYQHGDMVEAFFPREINFEKRKKEKLQRYLNVTRAELFFEALQDRATFAHHVLERADNRHWIHIGSPGFLARMLGRSLIQVASQEIREKRVPTKKGNQLIFQEQAMVRHDPSDENPMPFFGELASYTKDNHRVDHFDNPLPYRKGLYIAGHAPGHGFRYDDSHFKTQLRPIVQDTPWNAQKPLL